MSTETITAEGFVAGEKVEMADAGAAERAIAAAVEALPVLRRQSLGERAAILDRLAALLGRRASTLAAEMAAEAGCLTQGDMVMEVERAIDVIVLTAAAAREGFDEVVNVEGSARGADTLGLVRRVPIGPMLAITAFNGPILIATHKIAPAIAAGVPVVLKPSPRVPRAAVALAELVQEAGWPAGALSVLPVGNEETMALVADERLPVISFTGGDIGWAIREAAPRKHVHLELGGVGAMLVAADADLDDVAAQAVAGGFARSGQACLSVQRIYVEEGAHDDLVAKLAERVDGLRVGDPSDPDADIGPLVDERAAERVEGMVADATEKGARVLCGGNREGTLMEPTLLTDVSPEMAVARREVFGPVIVVAKVADMGEALREANATGGILQAGVFTHDIDLALTLADELQAGGVIVNGSNGWRVDNVPFGGVGPAGLGREGVRAMVEEMTQRKAIVVRRKTVEL